MTRSTSPRQTAPSRRRLQRPPYFTGKRLQRFRDVFLRHGLPGILLALGLLAAPEPRTRLLALLQPALDAPLRYAGTACAIALLLTVILTVRGRKPSAPLMGWMIYLLALSVWEEWIFRLALPELLAAAGATTLTAVLASNVLFGAAHYFTLRWKLRWCVFAGVGGLCFANAMTRGDFAAVVALHWVATWLNTPTPPSPRATCAITGTPPGTTTETP